MLLKIYVEDTLPFLQEAKKGNVIVKWLVQENLPLSHPQQLAAFGAAFGLSPAEQEKVDPATFTFLHGNETVDTSLTPVAAKLVPGTVLTMVAKSNTPRTQRQLSTLTPRGNDASPGTPRSDSRRSEMTAVSPTEMDADEMMSNASIAMNDEVYVSEECGWFPFHLSSNYGQLPVATCIDPNQVAKEADRNPPQQQLCPPCSDLLNKTSALRIAVDRHYKPMSLNFEVSEGWVEKLSMNRFSRWQKRYLILSDKSVDWFQEQPMPGGKAKIKGMRHVMRDGVINIADVIENPDPATNPKCKDTNYFHFGIAFKVPETTMFFRVPSLQQRTKYVTFLKQMVTRLSNTGAQKDPVYWKKWSDALLTNLADLGEVTITNLQEKDQLTKELIETRLRRQELRDELPGLQQVLAQQRTSVQALKRELINIDLTMDSLTKQAIEAEEKIELEKIELGLVEIQIGDELRKAEVLKAYASNQQISATQKISSLSEQIEDLKQKHVDLFARWRKLEEQNTKGLKEKKITKTEDLLSFSPMGIPAVMSARLKSRKQ